MTDDTGTWATGGNFCNRSRPAVDDARVRLRLASEAVHSARMEGLEVTAETAALLDSAVTGDLDATAPVEQVRARYIPAIPGNATAPSTAPGNGVQKVGWEERPPGGRTIH